MKPKKTREQLLKAPPVKDWDEIWPGFRVLPLFPEGKGGVSIGLFHCDKGGGSTPHRHRANQFLFCLEGEYYYPATGLRIKPGNFYMNPRDNAHGPAVAMKDTLMLEIYDGPAAPLPVAKSSGKKRASSRTVKTSKTKSRTRRA